MSVPKPSALGLSVLVLAFSAFPGAADAADTRRPILITVDDLPVSAGRLHTDPEEREAITRGLLSALAKHQIQAVGLATGKNHSTAADAKLLDLWLQYGHELGNHSTLHLDYSETDPRAYIADVDGERVRLESFLAARGQRLSYFRFPFLNERDTGEKLEAIRPTSRARASETFRSRSTTRTGPSRRRGVKARRAGTRRGSRR